MHWLSFIPLIFIGILPIVHSLCFSYFCTAEALWTLVASFQLYSHLVSIRSAAYCRLQITLDSDARRDFASDGRQLRRIVSQQPMHVFI